MLFNSRHRVALGLRHSELGPPERIKRINVNSGGPPSISEALVTTRLACARCAAHDQRAVSWTQPAMNIDLEIEGIPDRTVTAAIRKRVRMLGRQLDRSEDWRVRLVPSETQAEWDLGIRTSSGWHVSSFTTPGRRLADIV